MLRRFTKSAVYAVLAFAAYFGNTEKAVAQQNSQPVRQVGGLDWLFGRHDPGCCPPVCTCPKASSVQAPSTSPSDPSTTTPDSSMPSVSGLEAGALGTGSSAVGATPAMIGDFLGIGRSISYSDGGIPTATQILGRIKLAENTSPIPRDRVFLNYSYFHNVPLGAVDINIDRYSPGFEKTFHDGMFSIELRLPVAITLDSNLETSDTNNTEFGNIVLNFKSLLASSCNYSIGAGFGLTIPTADDIKLRTGNRVDFEIENRSVHLMPYIGGIWTPNDQFFAQWVTQIDGDISGSTVRSRVFGIGTSELRRQGEIEDTTFLYFDVSAGYWLYRNDCGGCLTGVAPIVEMHWNRSLESPDFVEGGLFNVGDSNVNDLQILNFVIGTAFQLYQNTTMTVGYSVPLGGGDEDFDGEFRLFFNHRFGPGGPAATAPY